MKKVISKLINQATKTLSRKKKDAISNDKGF